MKKLTITALLLLAALAHAEEDGVRGKVGRLADKGGQTAEKAAEATDKGLNKAAEATARPFRKADEWLSEKLHLKSRGASKPVEPNKNASP